MLYSASYIIPGQEWYQIRRHSNFTVLMETNTTLSTEDTLRENVNIFFILINSMIIFRKSSICVYYASYYIYYCGKEYVSYAE